MGQVVTEGPVTLTAGQSTTVRIPTSSVQLPWVVLSNSSPFTLAIACGAVTGLLAAFTADAYPTNTGADINITPQPSGALIAPGQDSSLFAAFYSEQPPGSYPAALGAGAAGFVTNGFFGQTITGVSTYQTAQFDTSGYQGARYAFENFGAAGPVSVELQWTDTNGNLLGEKDFILPGLGGSASFAYPHLGDVLTINLTAIDGGNLDVLMVAAHHNSDIAEWSGINWPNPPPTPYNLPGVLAYLNATVPATSTITANAKQSFAGPATLHTSSGGAATWSVRVMVTDDTNTLRRLYGFGNGDTPGSNLLYPVHVPPLPVQLSITNSDSVARNMVAMLVPDDWRVG